MPTHSARPAGSLGKAMKVHGAAGVLVKLAPRQLKLKITSPVMASQPCEVCIDYGYSHLVLMRYDIKHAEFILALNIKYDSK